jgi:hypothetical protein
MQTRYIAVCDRHGRHLKTYPITTAQGNGSINSELAKEVLERAKQDGLVPASEINSLMVKVPEKIKLWR